MLIYEWLLNDFFRFGEEFYGKLLLYFLKGFVQEDIELNELQVVFEQKCLWVQWVFGVIGLVIELDGFYSLFQF